jgi:hypothetical protein
MHRAVGRRRAGLRRMSGPTLPALSEDAQEQRADAERLRALVRGCVAAGIARQALLLRLSRLPDALKRPHHLRLARSALDPLSFADRARLFRLPNEDLAVVWRGEAAEALRSSFDAVLHLFADTGELTPEPDALLVTLSLPGDAGTLLQAIEESLPPEDDAPGKAAPVGALPTEPLDPPALAALEAALARADVARFMRRRQIAQRLPEGGFRLLWENRALSVAEIAATLTPDRAIRADPWLFRRLSRTLDRRMLALLAAPRELRDAGPFGLNLNVASILSPEFLRFDEALPAALRGQVVIDLLLADVMADPAAFLFARDFARGRGYLLLLRGVTADLLEAFPLRRIGLDLLQLRFSPELARLDAGRTLPDADHIVLSRADSGVALAWGRSHGIMLYQGLAAVPTDPRAGLAA